MGTRSRIGLALGPDQIVSVYCHYDGYIQFTGRKLVEHYNTKEQVEELIDGGDMSIIYTRQTWESGKMLRDESGECIISDKNGNIRYKNDREPQPLYYSERGEDCPPKVSNFKEFLSGDCGEEWCYLFTPGSGWQAWKLNWGEKTQEYDFVTEEPALLMTV